VNIEWFVCPTCQKRFYLKGGKLREWRYRVSKKPTIAGPFCDYLCSAKRNVSKALQARNITLVVRKPDHML